MTATNTTPQSTVPAIATSYFAAWNADDPTERRAAIEAAFTPTCRFTDPLADTNGHDELDAFIALARTQYAGHTFRLSSNVDAHHDLVRWTWDLVAPDATVHAVGYDVATLADDGRIAAVTGFFGPLQAA